MSGINVSEANAGIPRKARLDDDIVTALGFMLFLLVLWLIPTAWGVHGDIGDLHTRDVLRREGSETKAEITGRHGNREGVDVEYTFSVDGILYSGRAELNGADYRLQTPGTRIPIRYLANNPHINQPVDWAWLSSGKVVFYLLGLGPLAAAGVLIVAGMRRKQLFRLGRVVEGKVTGCAASAKQFKVYYEFTTDDGVSMEGSTQMPEECQAGGAIPVMYLRNNPKRNGFYPE